MAFIELSSQGGISSTIEDVIVNSPAASTRRMIRTINIHNYDTIQHTIAVSKKFDAIGTSDSELFRICRVELEINETLTITDVYILTNTNESIVCSLADEPSDNNLEFNCSYADVTTD